MNETDRTTQLESQITGLEEQLQSLRKQLSEAELDQWRGRIDDLEVQLHLGALDVRERVAPLLEDLRNAWLDARARVSDGTNTASDVATTLGAGLEGAMSEIRTAVLEARSAVAD